MSPGIAREDGGEVEPKSIHVHFPNPIAETVHDHPADHGMVAIEGVSGAGVIGVARAVRFKDVIKIVSQSTKAKGWPVLVTPRRCGWQHNVENDLDTRPMQRFHHVTELVKRSQRISCAAKLKAWCGAKKETGA